MRETIMAAEALARRNILVLTLAQSLGAAGPPIIISLGGIVGQMLSPDAALATLPVSLYSLGLAMGTIPAALIMRRFGRRSGYLLGAAIGVFSGLVATLGIVLAAFVVFCLGTFMAGFYGAYVQSYRFAAADAATGALKAKAISWVMIGGLAAAVIGPQLVIWTRDAFPAAPFAGSFLSQSALALLALPVLTLLRTPPASSAPAGAAHAANGRSLRELLLSPRLMLAIAAGIVSYALMSFVMTAAPIAMVGCGFTVGEAALGIQWHVLAMFAPSFVTGNLMTRFGKERVTALGLLLIAASGAVALMGLELAHFWISLILLGVGWNFGFIGATAMVTDCHTPEERGRVQGVNDFLIFGTVAAASFSAGTLLTASGWELINWLVFPAVALVLVPLLWRLPAVRAT
ncbi:MFS family permease [Pseudochelatococcus lubricantis]|uniref:MFS family permease n=2 Tax=Pseudochelatococcus lubricantis TaxID=1538102 RepID=A0ABX0V365_9HYPH|nr:MFS family permease [Pseudochelatococcus lubricantis]